MPQGSSQSRPHRVTVIVDEGTNPFEVGVATELFGLPRPELGLDRPPYEVTLCTPAPGVRMNHGFFTLTGVPGLEAVDDADTLVVPGRPDNVVPRGTDAPPPGLLDAAVPTGRSESTGLPFWKFSSASSIAAFAASMLSPVTLGTNTGLPLRRVGSGGGNAPPG